MKLALWGAAGLALVWLVLVALNPWALHIGGRQTPLLYWHGTGTVVAKDGRTYPLYMSFWPGRPKRRMGARREGKGWSADLTGTAWLCAVPGHPQRMQVNGTMYGGYTSTAEALLDFRVIEWRKPFAINYQNRGFFDVAGVFEGQELVLNRPNEQGIKLQTGPYIDHATARLHWASYAEFEAACR
ncbi:MAG: hypothetical protein WCA37_00760 [Terracidiphilus sp.]